LNINFFFFPVIVASSKTRRWRRGFKASECKGFSAAEGRSATI